MVTVDREMHQIAAQCKGRHLVGNCFGGTGRRFLNNLPYFLQNAPNIRRKGVDIFV